MLEMLRTILSVTLNKLKIQFTMISEKWGGGATASQFCRLCVCVCVVCLCVCVCVWCVFSVCVCVCGVCLVCVCVCVVCV